MHEIVVFKRDDKTRTVGALMMCRGVVALPLAITAYQRVFGTSEPPFSFGGRWTSANDSTGGMRRQRLGEPQDHRLGPVNRASLPRIGTRPHRAHRRKPFPYRPLTL
jgi:hypothetical protein